MCESRQISDLFCKLFKEKLPFECNFIIYALHAWFYPIYAGNDKQGRKEGSAWTKVSSLKRTVVRLSEPVTEASERFAY